MPLSGPLAGSHYDNLPLMTGATPMTEAFQNPQPAKTSRNTVTCKHDPEINHSRVAQGSANSTRQGVRGRPPLSLQSLPAEPRSRADVQLNPYPPHVLPSRMSIQRYQGLQRHQAPSGPGVSKPQTAFVSVGVAFPNDPDQFWYPNLYEETLAVQNSTSLCLIR